jgi:hypothetical protein
MPTNLTIPQSARNMFQAGMEQVAQQLQSRFRAYATVRTGCTGKSQAHRKIQKEEMNDVTGRLQPTNGKELYVTHRYVYPRKASLATVLDEDDAADLDLQVAPTGEIQVQHRSAAFRKLDSIFIQGITGDNYEGAEDNIQTEAASSIATVAFNFKPDGTTADSGLTIDKLIAGKSKFGKAEVLGQDIADDSKLCMAVSQDELDDLLYDAKQYVGSVDFNKVQALVNGEINDFMGIHFIRSERLPYTVVSNVATRSCPMWVNSGVYMDFWYDVKTSIDVLPQQSQAVQIYSRIKVGVARKDLDRVVIVQTKQSGY